MGRTYAKGQPSRAADYSDQPTRRTWLLYVGQLSTSQTFSLISNILPSIAGIRQKLLARIFHECSLCFVQCAMRPSGFIIPAQTCLEFTSHYDECFIVYATSRDGLASDEKVQRLRKKQGTTTRWTQPYPVRQISGHLR